MKCVYYIIAFCFIYSTKCEDRIIVEDTNVKDPQFERDAVDSYKEAHQLIPTDNYIFFQTFSLSFGSKQNASTASQRWKISSNCRGFYNPNKTDPYIVLHVMDSGGERHFRIFS